MNGAADAGPDELTVSMAAVDAAAARAVLADRLRLCGVDLEHPVVVAVLAAVVSAGWRPRPAGSVADGPVPVPAVEAAAVDDATGALFGDPAELVAGGWAR